MHILTMYLIRQRDTKAKGSKKNTDKYHAFTVGDPETEIQQYYIDVLFVYRL